MPRHRRPEGPLPDVFIGSHAVAEGLLGIRQLRGPYVARVLQGVYRPVWVPLTHTLKCQAACLVLPPEVAVTGPSAATVLGMGIARADDAVTVAAPDDISTPVRAGIQLRSLREKSLVHRTVGDVRLARPQRIAFDCAVGVALPEATARLDRLVRGGLVDAQGLRDWLATCHDNHVRAVRRAASLIDSRAESIPESVTRVHLQQAGLAVQPQVRVRDGSRVIARVDLAIEHLKIAIEYDGRWHDDETQRMLDNDRLAALRAAGWTVIVVTAALLRDPGRLIAAVRAAVAEREALRLS